MEDWLEVRRRVYTASEIAALVQSSKYLTPWQLYHRKEQHLPDVVETEFMAWGTALEGAVIARVRTLLGEPFDVLPWVDVAVPPVSGAEAIKTERGFVLVSLDQCIGATPDALGYTPDIKQFIVEVKTVDKDAHRRWVESVFPPPLDGLPGATRELPDNYVLQVQQQLHLTGLKWAIVAVLVGGNKLECHRVDYDPAIAGALVVAAKEANEQRLAGIEPMFDPYADGYALGQLVGSRELTKAEVELDDEECIATAAAITTLERERLEAKKEEDALKASLLKRLAGLGVSRAIVPGVGRVSVVQLPAREARMVSYKATAATAYVRVYPTKGAGEEA